MKLPKFRVGQIVDVASHVVNLDSRDCGLLTKCRILYPCVSGVYFVEVKRTGGYAMVDEENIVAYPEYDPQKPLARSKIRIVFFGNGQFALPTLKMLVKRGYDVACVVTMEDKPCGRSKELRPSAVKVYAEQVGIPVLQPHKIDSQRFRRKIIALRPTLGVIVEFRLLPRKVYTIPQWGTINLHSSLLPMYRGASTIASAIKNGDTLTGVTTFVLNDGIDTGGIINNIAVPIADEDNAEEVHRKLKSVGAEMVDDAIQRIGHSCGTVHQLSLVSDFIEPSYAPKIHKGDCLIKWWKNAKQVYDFIRALSPMPTAWTPLKMLGKDTVVNVKIHKASKTGIPRDFRAPGELFWQDRKLMIACADELLSIDVLQMPGKKQMTAIEFFNGFRGACKGFCIDKSNNQNGNSEHIVYVDANPIESK